MQKKTEIAILESEASSIISWYGINFLYLMKAELTATTNYENLQKYRKDWCNTRYRIYDKYRRLV